MKKSMLLAFLLLILPLTMSAGIVENFDDINTLAGNGWTMINDSVPVGTTGWFQGNPAIFDAYSGAPDSYIAANFNNAGFGGIINNWLITPAFNLSVSNRITFWTRTEAGSIFPDSLEVRLGINGSNNFTTLLLAINPTFSIGGYPEAWTQYEIDLAAMGPGDTGRVGFRYLVTDTSVNGDYIGIDSFTQTPIPEPMTLVTLGTGLLGIAARRFRKNRA